MSQDERGATLIEATVALPFLLVFLIVSLDLLRLSYSSVTVQFIAARVMRDASIGTMSTTDVQLELITRARNLGVSIETDHLSLCRLAEAPCTGFQMAGARSMMLLSVNSPMDGFLSNAYGSGLIRRAFTIHASVVGRIEPN